MSQLNKPRNLISIENFLSSDELKFWSTLLKNDTAWNQPHPNAGLGVSMTGKSLSYSEPYLSEYRNLLERICLKLEEIYEEPLCVTSSISFRKYNTGDGIPLHYDYSRDGDGKILQLHEETRRPGENAPYPAGLHDIQTVVYFNDDYSGGEVMFGDAESVMGGTGYLIEPKPGLLLTWPSTRMYGHGVRTVTSGQRYVMTGFWIRAKTLVLAKYADMLPENWREVFLWPEKVDTMMGIDTTDIL